MLSVVAVDLATPNSDIIGDVAQALTDTSYAIQDRIVYASNEAADDAQKALSAFRELLGGSVSGSPGDFDPNNDKTSWKVGERIDKSSSSGQYPDWDTVRERYWKNRAASAQEGEFSSQNLANMRNGNAPKARVSVQLPDGSTETRLVSKELHHINGRAISNPHQISNLQELWPWEHAQIDPSRYPGYKFLEFLR